MLGAGTGRSYRRITVLVYRSPCLIARVIWTTSRRASARPALQPPAISARRQFGSRAGKLPGSMIEGNRNDEKFYGRLARTDCNRTNAGACFADATHFCVSRRAEIMTSLKPISQLRFDCDTTTTRLRRKNDMLIFCSRRIASNGSRRARYVVVVSQSNRNCNHGFSRSTTFITPDDALCITLACLARVVRSYTDVWTMLSGPLLCLASRLLT